MEHIIDFLRVILRMFWIFPIQDKVVLTAYNGRQFGCSPKYLSLQLVKDGRRVYFALQNTSTEIPNGINVLKYRSIAHFYHLMTAKYIVINSSGITDLLPYRKKQVLINTWHGGGYFKIMGNDFFASEEHKRNRQISGNNTSFFLASCEAFAEQLPRAMSVSEKSVYRCGLPRNDLMIMGGEEARRKVRDYYKIPEDSGIVIYAPTYRDGVSASVNDSGFAPIDVDKVLDALEERFDRKFVFVFRAHHDMIPDNLSDNTINASDYSDMQELLAASDVFISDYSSCMWDFSLQRKPGFLYTPDLHKYEEGHPFGTKTEDWPYPLCLSNEELVEKINSFDERANNSKIEHYLKVSGSFEDGHATEKVIREIMPRK